MGWFNDMKISAKLLTGFILVAFLAGVVGYVGTTNIKKINSQDTKMYQKMVVPLSQIGDISTYFQRMRANILESVITNDQAKMKDSIKKANDRMVDMDALLTAFEKGVASDSMREKYNKLKAELASYEALSKKMMALGEAGKDAEAMVIWNGEAEKQRNIVQPIIEDIIKQKSVDAKALSSENSEMAASASNAMMGLIAAAVIISILLGLFIAKSISNPLNKLVQASDKLALGDVNVNVISHSKDEIGILMNAFAKMVENIKDQAAAAKSIAKGDLTVEIRAKSENDSLGISMQAVVTSLQSLVKEANMLSKAAVEGKLDTRGDGSKFEGSYREIVEGVNSTLDSVIGPLNVAAEYVDRISKGDIPPRITDSYNGDFNEIKNNLNTCIDAVNALVADAAMLSKAAVEGKLDTRADATKHGGDFGRIVDGVNSTLDSVIGPLNVAAEYVDRISKGDIPPRITDSYNGDFNEIKNNLNTCIDAVNALVADAAMLTKASVEGKLDTRADASKHGGEFGKIVNGVNATLDAVIAPVKEASAVLKEMSKGNLKANVKGNYMGDHAEIKDSLNDSINTIMSYVSEISTVLTSMANGNLDVGISADYRGDFVGIKNSLNNIVSAFNKVLGDINTSADQVASGSRQVSDGSQSLSQGATEQASAIEELTSSITEIAAQTNQNAINANQANELATVASTNAVQGNNQMKEMLNSMVEINTASTNISKIIKVIDEIAFQTNILALNAAVEAARAGQHGKGFAVVAEEVRNLAARSANAAKETTALIEGSIIKVEAGTKIANETAGALDKIVTGVEKAANLVAEIATASNEQAAGIAQINKGIEQVSQVIQTVSATAEESAAASEELSSQSDLLKHQVSRFELKKRNSGNYGNEFEELNPDVMLMLDNLRSQNKQLLADQHSTRNDSGSTGKIVLSDKEFGKY